MDPRRVPKNYVGKVGDTNACHIIKRAIAVFGERSKRQDYLSSLATLDIVRHYADLSDEFLENIGTNSDAPYNGMTLDIRANGNFDKHI